MDQINLWSIQTSTTLKFLQIYLKNKRHNRLWRILHADQRQKQNHKEENLLMCQASFRWKKESWLILNQGITLSLCIRDFEESDPSSSTLSNSTTRRRRSNSILEDQEFSSESISTNNLLVGRSLESMLVRRRRSEKEISVLYWYFRNNYLFPSFSKTFRGRQLLDLSLQDNNFSNMFTTLDVLFIFILSSTMDWYLEVRIQETDSILLTYWSQRQRPSRSCNDWLQ